QQQQKSFLKLIKQFTKHLSLNPEQSENSVPKLYSDNLVLQTSEFHYDPEADLTSNNCFDKCRDLYRRAMADIPEEDSWTPLSVIGE
ncbi:unnamed protein product, partial [Hymenolepis diminuta]